MSEVGASDRELVDAFLARGDERAFRVLYSRHSQTLYATAVRLTGHTADAEDAVHDTWLRAAGGLRRFAWRSALRTWLVGILINRVRELRRIQLPDVTLDDDIALTSDDASLPLDVDPIDLERALAAMPTGYREIVVLHDIEGFAHHEIAELLGIETGTSKSQLARGRRWLRRALAPVEKETT